MGPLDGGSAGHRPSPCCSCSCRARHLKTPTGCCYAEGASSAIADSSPPTAGRGVLPAGAIGKPVALHAQVQHVVTVCVAQALQMPSNPAQKRLRVNPAKGIARNATLQPHMRTMPASRSDGCKASKVENTSGSCLATSSGGTLRAGQSNLQQAHKQHKDSCSEVVASHTLTQPAQRQGT